MKTKKQSMTKFSDLANKWMKNPEFKAEYEALEPEFAVINAIVEKRIKKNLSQKELADKMGTKQSAISRLESGNANPSLQFLKKLAKALDAKLEISFS